MRFFLLIQAFFEVILGLIKLKKKIDKVQEEVKIEEKEVENNKTIIEAFKKEDAKALNKAFSSIDGD